MRWRILPIKAQAHCYGAVFANTLRTHDGDWCKDAFAIIRRELTTHVQVVREGGFDPCLMWEYAQVIDIASDYLRHKQIPAFTSRLFQHVYHDLAAILSMLRTQYDQGLRFSDYEHQQVREAMLAIAHQIKRWDKERARE